MQLIDSHCHLDRLPKYKIPQGLIPVTVGYTHSSNVKAASIAKKNTIPFALGIAPQTAIKEDISKLDEWIDFIRKNSPNAMGEVGLDYHWAKNEHEQLLEQTVFRRMLGLAQEMKLPLVIHARKATTEVLDFIQMECPGRPFMLHFFSGTLHDAKRAVEMGGLISIPPVMSKDRELAIEALGIESLLVESDAPYVGKTPDQTMEAVEHIAQIKKVKKELVIKQTADNAKRFFNIKE